MANEKRMIDAVPCECGNKPRLFSLNGPYQQTWYKLICLKCKAFVTAPSKEKAVERWNVRMKHGN